GRGGDLHVADHPGGVAAAQVRGGDLHVQQLRQHAGAAALDHGLVVAHGPVEGRGGLPGQTDEAEAVGPVVGDFKFHHGVVVADDLVDVLTNGAVLLENPDAVLDGIGEVVEGQVQLLEGAEHAVGGHAPELALGDMDAAGQVGVVQGRGHQV